MYVHIKDKFPGIGATVNTSAGSGVVEQIDVFNEEAIIRDSENLTFRVSPDKILGTVSQAGRPVKREGVDFSEQDYDVEETREALRKLDDRNSE
jgi:hypothetical protein